MTPELIIRFTQIIEHYRLPVACVHELDLLIRDAEERAKNASDRRK